MHMMTAAGQCSQCQAHYSRSQDMGSDFVNGTLGEVTGVKVQEDGCTVQSITFKPEGAEHELTVSRRSIQLNVRKIGMVTRYQFPLIPACAALEIY